MIESVEEKLKYYILEKYRSIREFAQVANIPYTTVFNVLDRSIARASASVIFQICTVLNIDANALLHNEIVDKKELPKIDKEQYQLLCEIDAASGGYSIFDDYDETITPRTTKTIVNYLAYNKFIERIPDADVEKKFFKEGYSFYVVTELGKAVIELKKNLLDIDPAFVLKFSQLNDDGKQRITDYLDDLIASGKYLTKDETCCTVDQPKKSLG